MLRRPSHRSIALEIKQQEWKTTNVRDTDPGVTRQLMVDNSKLSQWRPEQHKQEVLKALEDDRGRLGSSPGRVDSSNRLASSRDTTIAMKCSPISVRLAKILCIS